MAYRSIVSRDIALTFLGENIPVIGPRFKNREEAIKVARHYLEGINELTGVTRKTPVKIEIKRQADRRFSLVVEGFGHTLGELYDLDELFLKRFCKGLKKKLFIISCFVEEVDGLECLVLTEGLGAVFYAPNYIKKWRP